MYAYLRATAPGAALKGDKVSFTVPTGNFGDILAGYYAKAMGLPVDQLVVATNSNDILDRFFSAGGYSLDKNGVAATLSPSMDIGISSNFERYLFHMAGDDTSAMAAMMKGFEKDGKLTPTAGLVEASRGHMTSAAVKDDEVLAAMRRC